MDECSLFFFFLRKARESSFESRACEATTPGIARVRV